MDSSTDSKERKDEQIKHLENFLNLNPRWPTSRAALQHKAFQERIISRVMPDHNALQKYIHNPESNMVTSWTFLQRFPESVRDGVLHVRGLLHSEMMLGV